MNPQHMQTFRKNLLKILDDFKAKGIITGYEEKKEGRSYAKVIITKAADQEQQPGKKKAAAKKAGV